MLHLNNGWSGVPRDEAARCGASAGRITADERFFRASRDACPQCSAALDAVAVALAAHLSTLRTMVRDARERAAALDVAPVPASSMESPK